MFVAPLRLDEQAVQAEEPRILTARPWSGNVRSADARSRRAVTLRAEEQR